MTTEPWEVTVLTLFPEMFPGPLGHSIIGQALENKIWQLNTLNIRDYAIDKHKTVDDLPFGGGPGMVMRPDVIDQALNSACKDGDKSRTFIYLSPKGRPLNHKRVKQLANTPKVVMLCGRFEGVDQRVLDTWAFEEVSLGDFVLAGGEVASMALIEACVRLLPGVVGTPESLEEESFAQGLLEYPHYTRPRSWQGHNVPEVLLSGHHEQIRTWRLEQAEKVTKERRPDMWQDYVKKECKP